jgi:hypothetical protein
MSRAARQLNSIEPDLAALVVADTDLTLAAKLIALHALSRPGEIVTRHQLQALGRNVTAHLDEVVHELVRCHWLATVPAGERPCCATRYQLRQDLDG